MSVILQSSGGGQITIQEPATASNFTQTLPAASGEVMVSGNQPAFSAYASATQTVTLGTATKVAIDTENFDTASCFDTSTYRFTPNVSGYYQVNGIIRATVATTYTQYICMIYKNGSEIIRNLINISFPGATNQMFGISTLVYMNGTTDYLELYGQLAGTGTASFSVASLVTSQFSASLVRAA
jgi:hypothetical protein